MRSARPLIALGLIFAALVAIAVGVRIIGRPTAVSANPLGGVDESHIIKIAIENPQGKCTLERRQSQWTLVDPVIDVASDDNVDRLVGVLTQFKVGSVVSENDKHYAEFELVPGSDARVQVWLQGRDKPALDMHIGKVVTSYDSAYVRFEGRKEVRAAQGIMPFIFRKPPEEYRSLRLLPKDVADARSLSIQDSKGTLRLSKGAAGWTNDAGVQVSTGNVTSLISILSSWYGSGFASTLESAQTGLGNPTVTITVATSGATRSVSFGNKVPTAPGKPEERYARVEGRDAVFRVPENAFSEMMAAVKKLR